MTNTANSHPQAWYDKRADCLAEFITPQRYRTLMAALAMRTRYMTLLTENLFHPHNASALMRHCDAFGVQEFHTVETRCKFQPNASIVRGTDKWIDVRRHPSTAEALAALRAEGYRLVATTPHRESCTPETFDVTRGPFALIFGTEHAGISQEAMAAADEYLRIPMCGLVESLNVSASAAILIYMLSERVRQQVEGWQLPPLEAAAARLRWMVAAVRGAQEILDRNFPDDGD
ncbi:RNA methyltransferase [uncultured Alistipes sp.]|uniref:TrmH family RNA methyltransferase n=1 Tax=uncultured Alistipes sp. TaxID=538949 RepID=UPI002605C9FB|nr:RNA methyltransferase [uncultured Alistipes sp.]